MQVAVAAAAFALALTLQGCRRHSGPGVQPGVQPGFHGRVAVDGHACMHGWRARARGHTYVCHSYCCYHRSPITGRRTVHSYCRVHEFGHYALKACRPRYLVAAEAAPVSFGELGELSQAEIAEQDGAAAQEGLLEEEAEKDISADEAEALAEARA